MKAGRSEESGDTEHRKSERDVQKQTKEIISGVDGRVDVRLSYHNWKLAACVEPLKSIPIETVTEASGSSRSVEAGGRRRGEGEE